MQERTNGDRPDAMETLSPADWATADEIRRRRFTVVADGYAPDEIHDYLGHLAGTFATLRSQIVELRRTAPVANGPEGMSDLASRMADVLREAEEHAASTRQVAEQESTRLVADARREADRVREEARQEADRTVHAARADAEQAVAGHVEAARNVAADADKAMAAASAEAAALLASANEEAAKLRAGAEEAAAAARADADRRTAEALEFRDTVLTELRATMDRIAAAAPPVAEMTPAETPAPAVDQSATGRNGRTPVPARSAASTPADEDVEADLLS